MIYKKLDPKFLVSYVQASIYIYRAPFLRTIIAQVADYCGL